MEGFSGLCKWVGKMSDEWLSPISPVRKEVSETICTTSSTVLTSEDLGSSLSPLHSSREILAAYTDFTTNVNINPRNKRRSSKLSYSTLPLAADEMD